MSRKILRVVVSLVAFTAGALPGFADDSVALSRANQICQLINDQSALPYAEVFTEEFLGAVPEAQLRELFRQIQHDYSTCVRVAEHAPAGDSRGHFSLVLASGLVQAIDLAVATDGRIDSLWFGAVSDPSVVIDEFSDLAAALERLPGVSGFAFVNFDGRTSEVLRGEQAFALGSAFKLYVLGALQQSIGSGRLAWTTDMPLKDAWKSLPSGVMQDLPDGYAASAFEHAQKMISISDNTATDHLIHYVGRDEVESMLSKMGTGRHAGNLPFLTTLETFKLKWGVPPEQAAAYAAADEAGRRAMLPELASVSRDDVCADGQRCTVPTMIESLEWFATPEEICRAMHWLHQHGDGNTRAILGASTPFVTSGPSSHWRYVGYKGGSEPGVLNLTYLLESQSGQAGCLTISSMNPAASLDNNRLFDIVKKALKMVEGHLP